MMERICEIVVNLYFRYLGRSPIDNWNLCLVINIFIREYLALYKAVVTVLDINLPWSIAAGGSILVSAFTATECSMARWSVRDYNFGQLGAVIILDLPKLYATIVLSGCIG
jgi:hypothetical protein